MGILWTILIGLIAGLLARAIKPGNDAMGWIMTILLGIGGSVLANFIGSSVGWYKQGDTAGFIASVVGAIILLFIWEFISGKKNR